MYLFIISTRNIQWAVPLAIRTERQRLAIITSFGSRIGDCILFLLVEGVILLPIFLRSGLFFALLWLNSSYFRVITRMKRLTTRPSPLTAGTKPETSFILTKTWGSPLSSERSSVSNTRALMLVTTRIISINNYPTHFKTKFRNWSFKHKTKVKRKNRTRTQWKLIPYLS